MSPSPPPIQPASSSSHPGQLTARTRRSSSSHTLRKSTTPTGFLKRIRSSNNAQVSDAEDDDESRTEGHDDGSPTPVSGWSPHMSDEDGGEAAEMAAGPSDYFERQSSSTPSTVPSEEYPDDGWRKPSSQAYDSDAIEEGPSDYWGPGTPPIAPAYPQRSFETPLDWPVLEGDVFDEHEYERRIHDVLEHEADGDVSSPNLSTSEYPYHPSHTSRLAPDLLERPKSPQESTDVSEMDRDTAAGEEEFGKTRAIAVRDDVSTGTPSTMSLTPARLRESPYPPGGTPSPSKRQSYIHPSVSRLRSHMRSSSSTTQNSIQNPHLLQYRTPSHFSQISVAKSETMSTTSAPTHPSSLHREGSTPKSESEAGPAFHFHPLRRLSAHLFSRKASGTLSPRLQPDKKASSVLGLPLGSAVTEGVDQKLGRPTVMDINGMLAFGTTLGKVVVYGFGQDIKHILGPEDSNASVTAVKISSDQLYIAVGLSSGTIYLYDLSSPTKPARTAHALTLKQVQSGRREGHLEQSRILHVGFVGKRHTSIVSGDEHGRAFWWSLGKVMGVESTDVIRILGSYPSAPSAQPPYPSKKPTTLFASSPLPLGDKPHSTDQYSLAALLTPSKLVVVGMKPQAKTWFRKMRDTTGGKDEGGVMGCVAWLRSGEVPTESLSNATGPAEASDPVLAYSWGTAVRFLRVKVQTTGQGRGEGDEMNLEFIEGRKWDADEGVRSIGWYDSNHLLIITTAELIVLDVRSMKPVEKTPLQTKLLTTQDSYRGLGTRGVDIPDSLAASVCIHRGKLFLLSRTNLQVGTLLHWSDRILTQVHRGDFLRSISVALSYYLGTAPGNTIGLSSSPTERREVVSKRIKELMKASLDWAFSPERMVDDTHYSADGRGVDLTGLFEGLATTCIEACLAIGDVGFLFDEACDHYAQAGIEAIFLDILEPFIFSGKISKVPPDIIKSLITMHDAKSELDLAESVIWHVDPISLDINQAATLCEAHGLWDAMIHVYTRAMRDYVAPIVKLIGVVRAIQWHRMQRPALVGDEKDGMEEMAPNAYKLYSYLETVLVGLSYPSGEPLPEPEGHQARTDVYTFIFQGRTVAWPLGTGSHVLTVDEAHTEPPYPYLSLLLHFDTEAFLHAMDIAFEDPYLNDPSGAINRQSIVNLMLDVMDPEYFHPGDITFLHIFVARNLPKYPQFLFIPPSTLHRILISLASDLDQSTREDRQLAAEYLLSAYTPHDQEAMLDLFEHAGFFRILRAAYQRQGQWGELVRTLLRDPESSDDEVFSALEEAIKRSGRSEEVERAIGEALPQLFELDVRETAMLLDRDLPCLHSRAIASLDHSPHKQMAYLRCLLEPDSEESASTAHSDHVDMHGRHLYLDLLAKHDPGHVVAFLDERGPDFFDLALLVEQAGKACLYEAEIWALDRQGKVNETFTAVGDILRSRGGDLGQGVVDGDIGSIHLALETIEGVAKMAVRLCQQHSDASDVGHGPGSRTTTETMQLEDMWLGVLHEIIEVVHTFSALRPADTTDTVVLDALRALVQETLSSLVSCSSPALSFPRLFKRLVDASTSTSTTQKGRAYSEFRTILMGMLDSYRAEGEMLGMTTRLVQADLGEVVGEFVDKSARGWRPLGAGCRECGGGMGHGGWVVDGAGAVVHPQCHVV